ncbi:hypothetical protein TTHERM_001333161 (macronuclear) [Tetrahymena thermophila SB210]|uniref:Uncharacterized protein n=1 Tax=Tetrahymena thermophila (strain SB210) TaxID=312017 RepID=W7X1T8_TETTS|nr:hypothetical protein TTHERM_001333161 [Tetrahymena thermophila SB210]EWS71592.1 hypothetical protein TTHERM_001333161 [Tetrahymena thermophila SB210]|eukprot:XP_012655873.1 hypothetical protein TTHERM_001333161 [Tetrahymena thermophila SB210]
MKQQEINKQIIKSNVKNKKMNQIKKVRRKKTQIQQKRKKKQIKKKANKQVKRDFLFQFISISKNISQSKTKKQFLSSKNFRKKKYEIIINGKLIQKILNENQVKITKKTFLNKMQEFM